MIMTHAVLITNKVMMLMMLILMMINVNYCGGHGNSVSIGHLQYQIHSPNDHINLAIQAKM